MTSTAIDIASQALEHPVIGALQKGRLPKWQRTSEDFNPSNASFADPGEQGFDAVTFALYLEKLWKPISSLQTAGRYRSANKTYRIHSTISDVKGPRHLDVADIYLKKKRPDCYDTGAVAG